jgi:hypothetical protein
MAVGRITGQMLSSTLNRVTSDLTIRSTGEANLIQVDTSNQRVGIATASPTVPLDVTGAIKGSSTITATTSVTGGTMTIAGGSLTDTSGAISFGNENLTTTGQINTSGVRLLENEITTIRSNDDLILSANGSGGVQIEGSLTVSADLTVNGSTTTVNSTTLTVDDKNIELAHSPSGASSSDTLADGGGLILKGSTDHTILWNNSTDDWDFSETIDVASGKVYKVNGTEVLSGTTVTTANAVHNVISSSDSSSVRINDGLLVDGALDVGSNFTISNTTAITSIVDEDDMASNSATALSTQQSIKAYVDSQTAAAGVLTVIDDSSSAVSVTIADDDLKIAGGSNITTSASGDTLTVALDAAPTGLTAITIDNININGNTITATSGDITLAPAAGGDVNIGANLGLTFGNDGEKIEGDGTDLTISSSAKLNLTATSDVHIPQAVGLVFDTAGTEKIESDGTDLTISVGAGGDINLPASIGLTFGDDGEKIEGDGTDLTISSSGVLNLTATGNTAVTNNLTVGGTVAVSGASFSIGDINIGTNGITTDSNADLHITPAGSGNTVFSRSDNQIILPVGNTAARNGNIAGSIRYNSETGNFEGYSASGWGGLGGGDLTAVDDSSSSISVTLSQNSVKFAGGANITTSVSGTTITSALDTNVTGLTNLTVDNLNVNGNTITATSGDITLAPAASGDVNIGANLGLTFGDDGEKIEGDGTDLTISSSGKLNLTATSDVQIPADVGVLFGTGGEKIESDGTDLTATITGNFVFSGTGAIDVPVGTTGQRPTVNTGLIRFNSTLGVYEGSTDGSTYSSFLMAAAGEAADINKDVFTTSNDSTTAFTLSFTPAEAQNVLVFVDNIFQESTNNYTVSGTTLTMTAALHNGARLVVLHGFDGSGGVSGATWIGGTNTDIDSALENVDTFTTSTYRAAEYTYLATNAEGTGDSTTGHETGKILIVHDGSTAQMTQYGITHTSTAPVLTFSVDIDSGSVRLRAASIAANTKVRFARLGLAPL